MSASQGTHVIVDEWDAYVTDVPRAHTCCETCDELGCPAQHEIECTVEGGEDRKTRQFFTWRRLEERWGVEAVERIRDIVLERYRNDGGMDDYLDNRIDQFRDDEIGL